MKEFNHPLIKEFSFDAQIPALRLAEKMTYQAFQIVPEDTSLIETLERILDGCIVFEPSARLLLGTTDFQATGTQVVVAPERRRKPFLVTSTTIQRR